MSDKIQIAIAGAGRMGQAIAAIVERDKNFSLVGIWERGGDLDSLVSAADVVVDFSLPDGTVAVADAATRFGKPMVCGVSGLDGSQMAALDAAAGTVAIVYDRNMSQGITVLDAAVRQVGKGLGDEFSVVIKETHHVDKKDAPSGTALKLGESLAKARGVDPASIQYESQRHGEIPGDHAVVFETPTEKLTLRHSVTTRDVFAVGALRAASWVVGRAPGRYSMHQVLFDA